MNFKPALLEKVLAGTKTQTRRIKKHGETLVCDMMVISTWADGAVLHDRAKWIINHNYAVAPGRGKHGVGRMKIVNIWDERACDISEEDAQSEGFASCQEFLDTWDIINGKNKRDCWVWVIEFELVREPERLPL